MHCSEPACKEDALARAVPEQDRVEARKETEAGTANLKTVLRGGQNDDHPGVQQVPEMPHSVASRRP